MTKIDPTYENLVNLLAVFSDGKARLAALEALTNADFLALIDERKNEFAEIQLAVSEAEKAIKLIAEAHPEWFPQEQRTMKTPYGEVKAHSSTKHEVPDETATVAIIESLVARAEQAGATERAALLRGLVHVEKTVDLDAAGKLDANDIAILRILRIPSESITVKEAKVSLGNAVKSAEKKKGKKEKAEVTT